MISVLPSAHSGPTTPTLGGEKAASVATAELAHGPTNLVSSLTR